MPGLLVRFSEVQLHVNIILYVHFKVLLGPTKTSSVAAGLVNTRDAPQRVVLGDSFAAAVLVVM